MASYRTGWLALFVLTLGVPLASSAEPSSGQSDPERRGGIQWFATWESGLREAQRTGRPILLVAAAPHCAGVSGIW